MLVVTEGRTTEPDYVERLAQFFKGEGLPVAVKTVGVGKDPLWVVKEAILRRDRDKKDRRWDAVVCLVDVDEHSTLGTAQKLAEQEGIILIVSRLKFEMWLLWHLAQSRAPASSRQLDRLMDKHRLLTDNKAIHPQFPVAGVENAVRIARLADPALSPGRVGPDPSSSMPILVDLLRGEAIP